MIYLLFVGLQKFRGNLMSKLYYILPAKLTCVTVGLVIYFVLVKGPLGNRFL